MFQKLGRESLEANIDTTKKRNYHKFIKTKAKYKTKPLQGDIMNKKEYNKKKEVGV